MMPLETLWGGGVIPIGGILPYVGKTAPLNYLLCDGSVYNKSDYPELYNLITQNTSGGISSTTFNTPDLKGRFILGYSNGTYNMGITGGEVTHTLTQNEMPAHNHKLGAAGGDVMAVMTNRVQSNDIDQHRRR